MLDYATAIFRERRIQYIRNLVAQGLNRETAIELAALAEPECGLVIGYARPGFPYMRSGFTQTAATGAAPTPAVVTECPDPPIGVEAGLFNRARARLASNPIISGLRQTYEWFDNAANLSGDLRINGTATVGMRPANIAVRYAVSWLAAEGGEQNSSANDHFRRFVDCFSFGPTQLSSASGRRQFTDGWVRGFFGLPKRELEFTAYTCFYLVSSADASWGELSREAPRPRQGDAAAIRWLTYHAGNAETARILYEEGMGPRRPYRAAYAACASAAQEGGV